MSELELEAKMKQILDDYAPNLNVTPEAASLEQKPLQTKAAKKQTKPKNTVSNPTSNSTKLPNNNKEQSVLVKL